MVQRGVTSESGGRGGADGEPGMLRSGARSQRLRSALAETPSPSAPRPLSRAFTEGEERAVPEEQREAGSPTAEVGTAVTSGSGTRR